MLAMKSRPSHLPFTSHSINALLWLCHIRLITAICYYPDGTPANQDTPCSQTGDFSPCCPPGYACLSNNICMSTDYDEIPFKEDTGYVRGSCTDYFWVSANCPAFCMNGANGDITTGPNNIYSCLDPSNDGYYCDDNLTATMNCSEGIGILLFQGQPTVLTTIGVTDLAAAAAASTGAVITLSESPASATQQSPFSFSALSSLTAIATPGSSSISGTAVPQSQSSALPSRTSSTNSTLSPPSDTTNTGAIVGGVAAPLIVIIIALFAFIYLRRHRRRHGMGVASDFTRGGGHAMGGYYQPVGYVVDAQKAEKAELPSRMSRHNLHMAI